MGKLGKLLARVMTATKKYTLLDFALLKTGLLSLGIIFGAYFSRFFLNNILFFWLVAIVSTGWILYKTFEKY